MPPIIRKIVVRNVGVLKAFDTPASPRLSKLTTIYARNGRGKTTLSTILRSAATGDAAPLQGRRTLGSGKDDPQVSLVMDNGTIQFKGGRWAVKNSPIEVFDAAFIADNLYAGEAIDLEHDRGLFTIILGEAGVKLAKHQEYFNSVARRAAAALKDADTALRDDVPSDQSREEFFASSPTPALDAQVAQAAMDLKAIQQSDRLARLQKLEAVDVPSLVDPTELLARTIADIESSARERLAAHFSKFRLGKQGEAWIRFGVEHIHDDECPFCGKEGVDERGLTTVYGQIFGEAYQAHFEAIKAGADTLDRTVGADARAALATKVTANAEAIRGWSEFCDLSSVVVPDTESSLTALDAAHRSLKALFDLKRQTPLVAVEDAPGIGDTQSQIDAAEQSLRSYNDAISQISKLIDGRRAGTTQTEAQAKLRLENLNKRKRRVDAGVQKRIDASLKAKRQDARAKKVRTEVQARLKAASETSATHYHAQVNDYLQKFGATFRISKISNSMAGNVGSVAYGLVVRGHPVERGRRAAGADEASFKNTLSTGDKTTLAFAFFLAGLDRQTSLADKVVVFDDPLSSHDTHRQGKTIDILDGLCPRTTQLIVLSHDQHFLRKVSKRCSTIDQTSYEIVYDGAENWSKAVVADLDQLCQSDHTRQLNQLNAYYLRREGEPSNVSPAVRKVLETHYRRSFSAYFKPSDNLGPIITAIKTSGANHPCWGDLKDLESCNAGTMGEHHGDNPDIMSSEPIDPDGLHAIVETCLQLVNVIRLVSKAEQLAS